MEQLFQMTEFYQSIKYKKGDYMLDHCTYDKVKLLKELSSMVWFIEKHAKNDANKANDMACHELLEKLAEDMEKYIVKLREML